MRILSAGEITLKSRASGDVSFLMHQEMSGTLRYLRIYENLHRGSDKQVVGLPNDKTTWDIIKDALIDEKYERAAEIAMGVIGPWRPSQVLVGSLVDRGSNRCLFSDVIAGALWNLNLDHEFAPNSMFTVGLLNETQWEMTLRVYMVIDQIEIGEGLNQQNQPQPAADALYTGIFGGGMFNDRNDDTNDT